MHEYVSNKNGNANEIGRFRCDPKTRLLPLHAHALVALLHRFASRS